MTNPKDEEKRITKKLPTDPEARAFRRRKNMTLYEQQADELSRTHPGATLHLPSDFEFDDTDSINMGIDQIENWPTLRKSLIASFADPEVGERIVPKDPPDYPVDRLADVIPDETDYDDPKYEEDW